MVNGKQRNVQGMSLANGMGDRSGRHLVEGVPFQSPIVGSSGACEGRRAGGCDFPTPAI